ncbi:uncharacterized protein [Venturia canescens]|uniref:uncharacterized protein n=1 Tax=Venturia canescens TaxID=32260 RepID=UPI001C9CFCCE|nr:uncharacterized protein LOC122417530 [Venturia canescens]
MGACYKERVKEIGLAGNIPNSFYTSIASGDPTFTMVSVNDERSLMQGAEIPLMLRYKLQLFAVAVTSSSDLKETLLEIKNSRWWNHLARFYIFDSGTEIRCSDAFQFLWAAWTMDILKAKFICNHAIDGPLIYMFNPYTNQAGDHWKLERTYKGVNEHPWTLFVRKYDKTLKTCKNIDFDQTKNPGGYQVRISLPEEDVLPTHSGKNIHARTEFSNKNLMLLSQYMNLTINPKLCSTDELGFIDKNGIGHGEIEDLTTGRTDILFRLIPITSVPELRGNSWLNVKLVAVTQYTEYQSQWHKFIAAIDYYSRIGVCIVFVINVFFMKYVLRQSFMKALLNTLRLICNSCLVKLPNNFAPRIYLACLFSFFIIIQALYQGQLAARLSKHVRYPNINNKRDLMKSHYSLHGPQRYSVIFSENVYQGRFFSSENTSSCLAEVLKSSSSACVARRTFLIDHSVKLKLHMSKHSVAEFPMKYPTRENWPLEEKFQRKLLNYMSSGIYERNYYSMYSKQMSILDFNENGIEDDSFRVFRLEDLDFAFFIFAIGIVCAIFAFVVELYIQSEQSMRAKRRRRVARR